MPTIAAASYKHSIGEPFVYPNNELRARRLVLHLPDGDQVEFAKGIIGEPYARMVRERQITKIDIFFQAE